jgi:uncharacterized protein (TIGR03084 family)
MDVMDVVDDLEREHAQLDAMLSALTDAQWRSPSMADGWSVTDVVLHLAQTEEAVVASAGAAGDATWRDGDDGVDEMVDRWVAEQRGEPQEVLARWRAASRSAVAALRAADPDRRLAWAAAPLKPATLATTRIAEHWAHALDIAGPLGIEYPDTDRLRHVAWLGHHTLPYAFSLEGIEPQPVHVELAAPSGATWRFGDPDAPTRVRGTASDFCRIGARRLAPEHSGVVATGPLAAETLRVLRNYAR